MAFLYLATNKLNGKRYAGITRRTLGYRRYHHIWNATFGNKGTVFARAIRKHGQDNFIFSIVAEFDNYALAQAAERKYISTHKPEYNMAAGGVGPTGLKWTPEWRSRALAGMKKSWTEDRKKKISDKLRGRRPSALAIQRSAEAARLRSKKILCLNNGAVGSAVELAAGFGVSKKSIYEICRGVGFSVSGYFFIWLDDCPPGRRETELARRMTNSIRNRLNGSVKRRRGVIGPDESVYESGRAAAVANNLSVARICQLCGKGERFRYIGSIS